MNSDNLKQLLLSVQRGAVSAEQALDHLKHFPFDDQGFVKIDHHRELRKGFPEVIYCQGKSPEQVAHIVERLYRHGATVLATRASEEVFTAVRLVADHSHYNQIAKVITIEDPVQTREVRPGIVVLSAGTADIPVAEEAAVTSEVMGNKVERVFDVGVAGLHRLFASKDKLLEARVVVVVAGMDGALASVVGGLVDKPVIGVPTSIGYGASFGGVAALLTMLNSCAPGVAVVNIDNGFGAGYLAAMLNRNTRLE